MSDRTSGDLARFREAQDANGTYARALEELRRGRKTTHWMWFVFPQLAGLGRSSTAQFYALHSRAEARAYLADPLLGSRLRECCEALLRSPSTDPVAVLGPVDAMKLRSSMTLFLRAAPEQRCFAEVLDRFFAGKPDQATDDLL